jgi:hypothetical protein
LDFGLKFSFNPRIRNPKSKIQILMTDWKLEIKQRLAGLNLDPTREAEIVDEFAQHLEDRYVKLLSGGAKPEDAKSKVRAELIDSGLWGKEIGQVERQLMRDSIALGSNRRSNLLGDLLLPALWDSNPVPDIKLTHYRN